jgi:hypothetical protein
LSDTIIVGFVPLFEDGGHAGIVTTQICPDSV